MKIDYRELQNQRREEILKSEHYARVEIIVSLFSCNNDGNDIPCVNFELCKVDDFTIAYLTRILEDTSKLILKEYNLEDSRKIIDESIKSTTAFIPKD